MLITTMFIQVSEFNFAHGQPTLYATSLSSCGYACVCNPGNVSYLGAICYVYLQLQTCISACSVDLSLDSVLPIMHSYVYD